MKQVKPCPFECNANDCKDCGAYTYSHHTQTNDEWRKTCSAEEFAEWIYNNMITITTRYAHCGKDGLMAWLKAVHKNDLPKMQWNR